MKKLVWKKCWNNLCFLKHFFSHLRKIFPEFLYKILVIAVYMRSSAYNFLNVFLQIIIQNYNV